jgi:hypothetical protein
MSKRAKTVIISLILIVVSMMFTSGPKVIKAIENDIFYKEQLGIELPKGSIILKEIDTHGGFHGDGEYYSEIQLTKDGEEKFAYDAKKTGKWTSLPLPKNIQLFMYGGEYNSVTYGEKELAVTVPKDIKNGMFYIRDRYAETYPKEKDIDINSRFSYNVTISILDLDTHILYIYALDT